MREDVQDGADIKKRGEKNERTREGSPKNREEKREGLSGAQSETCEAQALCVRG